MIEIIQIYGILQYRLPREQNKSFNRLVGRGKESLIGRNNCESVGNKVFVWIIGGIKCMCDTTQDLLEYSSSATMLVPTSSSSSSWSSSCAFILQLSQSHLSDSCMHHDSCTAGCIIASVKVCSISFWRAMMAGHRCHRKESNVWWHEERWQIKIQVWEGNK